jgi:acyl carrier protein
MADSTAQVKQFIVDEFMPDVSVDELGTDFDLLEGGVVDSLGLLKVVAWLESEYDIEVDDSELGPDSFRTPQAIATYVDESRGAAANAD